MAPLLLSMWPLAVVSVVHRLCLDIHVTDSVHFGFYGRLISQRISLLLLCVPKNAFSNHYFQQYVYDIPRKQCAKDMFKIVT